MIDRCLRYFLLFSISAILIIAPIENARANLSLVVPVVRASAPRFQHAIAKVLQDKVLSIVTAGVDSGAIVNGPEVVVATRVAQTAALSDMVASGASVAAGGLLAIGGAPVWLGVLASAGIGLGVGYIASDYFDIAFDKDSSPPVPANPPAPPSVTPSIAPKDSLGQGSPFKMPVMIDYAFPPFVSYNFAPAPLVVSSVYPEATFFDIAALPNPFVALTPNDLSKLPFSYKYYSDIGTKRFYFSDFADLYNGVGSYLNESLAANKFNFPADLNLYYSDNYSGVMGSPLALNNLYGLGVPRNLSGIKRLIGDPSAKTICTTGCYTNVNRLDFTPVDVFFIPTDASGKSRFGQFLLSDKFTYTVKDASGTNTYTIGFPAIDNLSKVTSAYREFYSDNSGVDLFFNLFVRGKFTLYIGSDYQAYAPYYFLSDLVFQLGTYMAYNKNPFYISKDKKGLTLADLWRVLSNEDALKKRVKAELIADAANEAWRRAAARPDYRGIPYDATRAITPSEVEARVPEDIWPQQRELFSRPDITLEGAIPWTDALNPPLVEPIAREDAPADTKPKPVDIAMTCGGWFQPACNIDWGVEPSDSGFSIGGIPDFLKPLLSLFLDFKAFNVPSHTAVCPSGSVDLFGKTLQLDYQCYWLEQHRSEFVSFFSAVFLLVGLVILLRS